MSMSPKSANVFERATAHILAACSMLACSMRFAWQQRASELQNEPFCCAAHISPFPIFKPLGKTPSLHISVQTQDMRTPV
eukprot:CAMPEP_0194758406 /NCGR_PEP_ID=MMETSP0323_2-20130528/11691_1 /TAXON_ID=2866 ORGANISM="Crypthecodinium cohnii, Strain Seligo" /NCGR_SAMPLE_ID=MMETSP0323_2 /ASSEMBLY_ACC=CAM_ASM_000346 /LENGTH=79 /DNA_ID=CAMNT_0039678725 /DNA_START=88 /DNA_END=324 /DNA_ORIENTATION=+